MNRLQNFEMLSNHPLLYKSYNRLTKDDLELCKRFISEHGELSDDLYAQKINRWYLDLEKPKNYSLMWAMLTESSVK